MTDSQDSLSRPSTSSANLLLVTAVVVLAAALTYQTWKNSQTPVAATAPTQTARQPVPRTPLGAVEESRVDVFRRTSPSVVFIRTKGLQVFNLWGGQRKLEERELSSGTGFVWDDGGHIVTNLHVVEDALRSRNSALEVQFSGKSIVDAEFIGGVREFDIALLKVQVASELSSPIPLGTSDDLEVGQEVLAIGSPFGFDQTLSTGVIGGLNRSVAASDGEGLLSGLVQTDAAINPGNSGGPLLDSAGRMIGVNTAIVSPTGAYSGLGFAVPVSSVIQAVETILDASSEKPRPVLGISVLSPAEAKRLGAPDSVLSKGLFISRIDPNGPAAGIGLRPIVIGTFRIEPGHQITALNGEPVTTPAQLQAELDKYAPGDVVKLDVVRGNQRAAATIELQASQLIL